VMGLWANRWHQRQIDSWPDLDLFSLFSCGCYSSYNNPPFFCGSWLHYTKSIG